MPPAIIILFEGIYFALFLFLLLVLVKGSPTIHFEHGNECFRHDWACANPDRASSEREKWCTANSFHDSVCFVCLLLSGLEEAAFGSSSQLLLTKLNKCIVETYY